jgi:predicted ATPase
MNENRGNKSHATLQKGSSLMSRKQPIEQITIQGFKSIQQLDEFQLRNLNILIGANGAGKSNFVDYCRLLRKMVNKRLQVWTQKQGGRIVS